MSRVLVTGAGGFIGSHLTEMLVKEGYAVRAFVHYNSKNSWGWLEQSECRDDIDIHAGDIRDYDSVAEAVNGCDTVFHLAALIGIPYSYVSPIAYIRTNVEGTYNVLQAARQHNISNILVTSTSETYGSAQYVPMDEAHPLVGQSPYSASKIAADQLAISYHRSFELPVKIVRPFNTFGPRQSARAIIPTVLSQILSGSTTISIGNSSPTRDFTYVEDTVSGFLHIANSSELIGEVTNIGAGSEISIGDLVEKIATLLNSKVSVECETSRVRPEASEVDRLFCTAEKLSKATEWTPRIGLDQGILNTAEWLKNHLELYKQHIYNV